MKLRPLPLLVVACLAAARATLASPPPNPEPTRVLTLEETTQGTLGSVDVGVANIWERGYTDATGAERTGQTARLMWDGGSLVVGSGSVFELGGHSWRVLSVDKPADGNGSVRIEPAS
jgi:hypothetical protein